MLVLPVTLVWFGLNVWDTWHTGPGVISRRFGMIAAFRISAALSALVILSSGLLWWHHKQEASYTTPLEFFFGICSGFFLFVLMLSGAGAVFGG